MYETAEGVVVVGSRYICDSSGEEQGQYFSDCFTLFCGYDVENQGPVTG